MILRCQIRIEIRYDTVNVAGSGKLEKRRYDIYLDPEIQTQIERHNNAEGAVKMDTHIWFGISSA